MSHLTHHLKGLCTCNLKTAEHNVTNVHHVLKTCYNVIFLAQNCETLLIRTRYIGSHWQTVSTNASHRFNWNQNMAAVFSKIRR